MPEKKPRKKKPAGATTVATVETVVAPELGHITEALRPLATSVDLLVPDPANARKHSEKNLTAIAASLRVYGQRTPIVANRANNVVLKGNGTLAAARSIGWTHLAVVWVEDDPATAAGYSIADNRTAELAEWDEKALDQLLRSVQTEDQELATMLDELAQELDLVPPEESGEQQQAQGEQEIQRKFQVIVDCKDEEQQLALLEEFDLKGLEARALTV